MGRCSHKHSAIWMWDNDTRAYAAGVLLGYENRWPCSVLMSRANDDDDHAP